jgi:hypothetical protein
MAKTSHHPGSLCCRRCAACVFVDEPQGIASLEPEIGTSSTRSLPHRGGFLVLDDELEAIGSRLQRRSDEYAQLR